MIWSHFYSKPQHSKSYFRFFGQIYWYSIVLGSFTSPTFLSGRLMPEPWLALLWVPVHESYYFGGWKASHLSCNHSLWAKLLVWHSKWKQREAVRPWLLFPLSHPLRHGCSSLLLLVASISNAITMGFFNNKNMIALAGGVFFYNSESNPSRMGRLHLSSTTWFRLQWMLELDQKRN